MSLEGLQLGRYRFERMLGSGGMGEVYLATDTLINRQVAIKVIRAEVSSSPNARTTQEATRLFQREMKAISALDHPHILPLFDYGESRVHDTNLTYMVIPYRPEGSLTTWLRRRRSTDPLSLQEVTYFINQAASALQHAHNRQIIHQDVKPANFLIQSFEEAPGRPNLLLSDFGVAKFNAATSGASQSIRGTPGYMAPEQWEGLPIPATDQYALAVMAYELLTGRPPFQGGPSQVMYQHFNSAPTPPSIINPQIPQEIDAVLLRALAKKPEGRFPSVSAFASAFQAAAQSIHSPGIASSTFVPETITPSESRPFPRGSDNDIRATLAISETEALAGTSRTLTLPGGRHISVNVPPGAYDGQIIRLERQGEPGTGGSTGALILTLAVHKSREGHTLPSSDAVEKTVRASSDPNLPPTIAASPTPAISTPPPPSRSTPARRSPLAKGKAILSVVVALVIIAGSLGLFFAIESYQAASSASATATTTTFNAHASVIAQNASATANAFAFQSTATAQAQAYATATASTIAANPYPSYLPGGGTLAFYDPLRDDSYNNSWDQNSSCTFTGGAYHVTTPDVKYFSTCGASFTNFTNFAFEVKMNIIKGDSGGVIFRADTTSDKIYVFFVDRTGYFEMLLCRAPQTTCPDLVSPTFISAINQGLNQTNLIAVVAKGNSFMFYLNQQQVVSINDSTYSSGEIGVVASPFSNANDPTDVAYSNARVWTF